MVLVLVLVFFYCLLVISHNEIKSLAVIGRLPALTKLSASHNQVSDLSEIGKCAELRELRVNNNRIVTLPESLKRNVK